MKLKFTPILILYLLISHYSQATTFIVTSNADNGTGTLREAMINSNSNSGMDTIHFNMPDTSVAGRTITLLTALPNIFSSVVIDGNSQQIGHVFGISHTKIQITTANNLVSCFVVSADSCEFYGLFINNFQHGMTVQSPFVKIGAIVKGNVFYNCSIAGILVQSTDHVAILANLIGLDTAQAMIPGATGNGIEIVNSYAISIGGKTNPAFNIISGNNYGVHLSNAAFVDFNSNCIGTDLTGTLARPNQYGIYGTGANTSIEIGGDSSFEKNIISGNINAGIYGNLQESRIQGDFIGTTTSGTPLGNGTQGIYLSLGSIDNLIGGSLMSEPNTIAYNGDAAIVFQNVTCKRNTITHNSIFCNSTLTGSGGIDISTGNLGILPPELLIVNTSGVAGTTVPNGVVELYGDDTCQWCEGKTFIATVSANGAGNFTYLGSLNQRITATVTDTGGNTSNYAPCVDSAANACVIGGFIAGVTSFCAGTSVIFFDQSVTTPGTSLSSWNWNFGDSTSSTDQSPGHIYSTEGLYTVKLIVSNSEGCSDTITHNIIIYSSPVAQFSFDPAACTNAPVNFDDQSSGGTGATISHWDWDFGDGTNGSGINPSHTYTSSGTFNVSLTVTNTFGCTNTLIQQVNVLPAPVASFTMSGTTLTVSFTSTSSANGPASYHWDFGNGISSDEQNPTYTYPNAGVYTVCLTVYDSTCQSSDSSCQVIDIATGVSNPLFAEASVLMAPNPANDYITISASGLKVYAIELLNVLGSVLYRNEDFVNSLKRMSLAGFSEGLYLVRIETDKGVITKKLTIYKK